MAFCRELARELAGLLPTLDAKGVKLFLVSIGPPPRGFEFSDLTGFPAERLITDPSSELYEALGLYSGIQNTFFRIDVRPCPLIPSSLFCLRGRNVLRLSGTGGLFTARVHTTHDMFSFWVEMKI